jgi:molybdopterin/thiamine biosynthesis adenylyltransferase
MPVVLNDSQLERYSRQILLPQVDLAGQSQLLDTHVIIIGLGGLGSAAAIYLTCSGIGKLTICDADRVEANNLQRQIVHQTADIGNLKTESAKQHLLALNPDIDIRTFDERVNKSNVSSLVRHADCIVDASDNFVTRYMLNHASFIEQTPLISGSAIRFQGQVAIFNATAESPCYQCLYPQQSQELNGSCSDTGVLSPLVGIIGSMMATETLKLLLNIGQSLDGYLLTLDVETMTWKRLGLARDPGCPVCSQAHLA